MQMKAGCLRRFFSLWGVFLLLASQAWAQDAVRIEIAGVGARQIPVAVAGFPGESAAGQKVSAIIRADLERSGLFNIVDTPEMLAEDASVDYKGWRAKGVEALATGSVKRTENGRYEVRYALYDVAARQQVSSLSLGATDKALRLLVHKVADDIYEKLTGEKGMFSTRIAYITKSGKAYQLEVADADGENRQVALRSNEPVISPAWSPDGRKIAYVSFEAKKPVVYVQDLVTRKRTVVANYKGSNSAPAWSPDGSSLAVALSRDGLTQIYWVNADGKGLRRLTKTSSINTEPQFSPDGQFIYFTSDRSGSPQIYRMGINGDHVQRVTFSGGYNISPRVAPDGRHLAYISRREGKFQVYLLDLANNQELRLSDTSRDESPSFAPNGKYVMYATEKGRRGVLSVVSTDGHIRQNISMQASDIREPAWGPYMK
ncbi:MAG: Tol-Pal system beta propeller repeat protein TolB [Alistipes senegalensis]|nr:Tol-Pal system beta propeller repeat protein TolB [Oxalobacter formigenes]MCM1281355.1 Tol-Pal system beta propeller repeat protein TolB [Alistipes senegalensis]